MIPIIKYLWRWITWLVEEWAWLSSGMKFACFCSKRIIDKDLGSKQSKSSLSWLAAFSPSLLPASQWPYLRSSRRSCRIWLTTTQLWRTARTPTPTTGRTKLSCFSTISSTAWHTWWTWLTSWPWISGWSFASLGAWGSVSIFSAPRRSAAIDLLFRFTIIHQYKINQTLLWAVTSCLS